jgi:hypothetical protein
VQCWRVDIDIDTVGGVDRVDRVEQHTRHCAVVAKHCAGQ